MEISPYIVTEYEVNHFCCSSQRDNEIYRTYIGVIIGKDKLEEFIREWIRKNRRVSSIEESKISKAWIDKIIEVGSLKPRRRGCCCGLVLFIDNGLPHAIEEKDGDHIREIIGERTISIDDIGDDQPEESGEFILVECYISDTCCEPEGTRYTSIRFMATVSEEKLEELIKSYIQRYSEQYLGEKTSVTDNMVREVRDWGSLLDVDVVQEL